MPRVDVNNNPKTDKTGLEPIKWNVTNACATAQSAIKILLNSRKSKTSLNIFFIGNDWAALIATPF